MRTTKTLLIMFISSLAFFSLAFLFTPITASAATAENCQGTSNRILQFPTWYKYLNPTFSEGQCNIQFSFPADIGKVLLAVFEILLRLAGILAVIFTIWGGFQYILSQGEPERASHARSTIVNALIGLAITVSAVAIVNLLGRNLA